MLSNPSLYRIYCSCGRGYIGQIGRSVKCSALQIQPSEQICLALHAADIKHDIIFSGTMVLASKIPTNICDKLAPINQQRRNRVSVHYNGNMRQPQWQYEAAIMAIRGSHVFINKTRLIWVLFTVMSQNVGRSFSENDMIFINKNHGNLRIYLHILLFYKKILLKCLL